MYVVLVIILDFTARTIDKYVSICLDGLGWKTEPNTLILVPDLPVFLRSKGMGGGKKLAKVKWKGNSAVSCFVRSQNV